MNQLQDDMIDALLRRQFDGPVRDEAFSVRVMQRLPQRRCRRIAWPLWIGVVAGAAMCWLALLPSRLLRDGWQDWSGGHWSIAGLAMLSTAAVMTLLAIVWGVVEINDR